MGVASSRVESSLQDPLRNSENQRIESSTGNVNFQCGSLNCNESRQYELKQLVRSELPVEVGLCNFENTLLKEGQEKRDWQGNKCKSAEVSRVSTSSRRRDERQQIMESRSAISTQLSQTQESTVVSDISSVELQLPRIIVENEDLLWVLNTAVDQFVRFLEFLGRLAISMYKTSIICLLSQIFLNFGLSALSSAQCLFAEQNHIFSMGIWMMIEAILSSFVVLLISMHLVLRKWYKYRRSVIIGGLLNKAKISWIVIWGVKYFIVNSFQSFDYFSNRSVEVNAQQETGVYLSSCSGLLDFYLCFSLIHNYFSLITVCIFCVEELL